MMWDSFQAYEALSDTLSPEAAKILTTQMGKLYQDVASAVTKEEFHELKTVVFELAEAQKRTETRVKELAEKVEELAEAQKRTETRVKELAEKVEELAEAQKRTEARVEELAEAQKRTEARIEELAEAQKRTEVSLKATQEEVAKLARGLQKTRRMVGGLSDTVGYLLEDRAIHSLPSILNARFGITVEGSLRRGFVEHPDGRTSELNIFGRGADSDGQVRSILGEAKSRLSRKHVDGLLRLAKRLAGDSMLEGEPFLLLVAYSVDPRVERYAQGKGIVVIGSYELDPYPGALG